MYLNFNVFELIENYMGPIGDDTMLTEGSVE